MSIRVDTAPLVLKPLIALYGFGLGLKFFAWYGIQRVSQKIEISGTENLAPGRNYIFCHWHGMIPLMLQCCVPRIPKVLDAGPHAWMQHPLWYMKPVHVFIRLIGVRGIVLGSTGHDGRRAADELVELLRAGCSTFVFPDGPAGPRHTLHRGALHLSAQSGVPIVPIRLEATRAITAPTWDRKQWPLPFATITMRIGKPITVAEDELEEAANLLVEALGEDAPASNAS